MGSRVLVVVAGAVARVARRHLGKLDPILILTFLLGLSPAHARTGPGEADHRCAMRDEGSQRCSVDQEKSYEKRWPHERQLGVEAVCQP